MPPRAFSSPIDRALAKLHQAIATPHRVGMVRVEFAVILNQIPNSAHRAYLQDKFEQVEEARTSARDRARIGDEVDAWNDREFPVGRGYGRR